MQSGKNMEESTFEPASFRVQIHDSTTELPWQFKKLRNTTVLIKTYVTTVILAQPALINASATQSQGAAISPPK